MINTQVLKGNLIRQDYTTAFVLNQGDKGVPFKIELLENGAPYILQSTDIVTIEWLKPNGSPFLQDTGITKGDTYVEITTPEAISQSSGSGTFNIIISDGTTRKGTIKREYKVVSTSLRPGSVSEGVITDAITELRNLNTKLAETVQNNQEIIKNNTAATKQDIATVNSSLEDIAKLTSSNTATQNKELIQNKINSYNIADVKGNKGEYEIDDSILLKSNTTLRVNNAVTIKNSSTATSNVIKKDPTIDRIENIKIDGGIYDYNLLSVGGNNNHAIFLNKADNIKLEDMTILNARKYAFLLADINRATIRDIKLNTSSDGIHFQPPLKDIYVNNIQGTTGDDMLAITIGDYASYNTSAGDVEDFYASNIYPLDTMTVLKLCGQENYKFKRVVVENVAGSTFHEGFYFRVDGDILNDFTADYIRLSNIKVKTGGDDYPLLKLWTNTQMNINTLILEDVEHDGRLFDITGTGTWTINIKNLHLRNIKNIISNASTTLKYNGFIGTNVIIENLYLDNIELNSDEILSTVYECFIENRGTIKNLYINGGKVKFPVNQYALIRNINGTINNLNIDNYYQYQGACVYYQNAKTYTGYIRINNTNLDEVWEAFNVNADTIITLASTTTSRNGATFRTNNSAGTYKISGELINTANVNVSCVAGASVGNILVDGNINVDIEKVKGRATGARCYNTNRDVFTGRGYYTYANWGWEKEANKNVVRYITEDYTIGKYDSFIKANGAITITLPDSSSIMGKSFVIFNVSTTDTVTINDTEGTSVGTIAPNTRKDIISGGSIWHIF